MSASSVSLSRQTFRKSERLSSRKVIQELSLNGKNIRIHPIRLLWLSLVLNQNVFAQVAFSVPKRNFKNATDRNRIKRRMREAYRKNKSLIYPLISQKKKQFALLFVYSGKEIVTYMETEEKLIATLNRFAEVIQKNNN